MNPLLCFRLNIIKSRTPNLLKKISFKLVYSSLAYTTYSYATVLKGFFQILKFNSTGFFFYLVEMGGREEEEKSERS